jgi:hypothetical protein
MKEANREVLDGGSLPELLAGRARQSSDRRLAADAAIGVVVASALAVLRPPLWFPLAALAATLAAYGAWGILDREVRDAGSPSRTRLLQWARVIVALLGAAAAMTFGLTLFGALLGPIIS